MVDDQTPNSKNKGDTPNFNTDDQKNEVQIMKTVEKVAEDVEEDLALDGSKAPR